MAVAMDDYAPPMPLKHFTETFLIVLLAAVTVLTGLLIATLPNIPEGALPWAALFVLSIIYPLSLYSLFQKRRADNFFRNLHWLPAIILLLWMLVQGLSIAGAVDSSDTQYYAWGWTIGPVAIAFVLFVLFCLKVIRRRLVRLFFLALIFVPFAAAAIVSEREGNWEQELASILWEGDVWQLDESGLLASWVDLGERGEGDEDEDDADEDEQKEMDWREKLKMQERREERIAARTDENGDPKEMVAPKRDEPPVMMAEKKPDKLTDSGFGWSAIILTLVAGYCATLHNRMRKVKVVA